MIPNDKLKVLLEARKDKTGATYYVGRLNFPGYIDCSNGVAFLIFTSDQGNEEMQIAPMRAKEEA